MKLAVNWSCALVGLDRCLVDEPFSLIFLPFPHIRHLIAGI